MPDDSPKPHPTAGGLRLVGRDPRAGGDVSWMELFVDLFFVFAFLKVTALMSADLTPVGVVRGILVLLLLWHSWTACAWLGNLIHLDRGVMPLMMAGIATVVLVIGVAVPEAFVDRPGSLPGPLVVMGGYLLVRLCILVVLTRFRWHEGPPGRRPAALAWSTFVASAAFLLTAALLPPRLPPDLDPELVRIVLFALALGADFVILAAVGRGSWQIVSPWHLAERHGLIVLIALGETIISIGTSRGLGMDEPVTWPVLGAAILGVAIVSVLWWTYFDLAKSVGEHALWRRQGIAQTRLGRDAYSGLHLFMIGGLIIFALGLKHAVAVVSKQDTHPWIPSDAVILYGGIMVYLLALVAFERRTARLLGRSPLVGVGLLLALLPLAANLLPLGSLALLAAGVAGMVVVDRTLFRRRHEHLHRTVEPEALRFSTVTPTELFVDLVFVFAFVQVTVLMTRQPTLLGVIQGLTLLALLWWAWTSYAWLANAIRTETSLARFGTAGIVTAILVLGIAIPQAFDPGPASLPGSLLVVACYLVSELIQGALLRQAARSDPALRSIARQTAVPSTVSLLLLAGFAVAELTTSEVVARSPAATILWIGALVVQFAGSYRTGVRDWRLRSVRHWIDRYALIMLIAFGEAIISIGIAVNGRRVSGTVVVVVIATAVALGTMWWAYFTTIDSARLALQARTGVERAKLARDAYTYLHLPMVAGIVLIAYGLRQILAPPEGSATTLGHYALFLGVSCYLAANQMFWWRTWRTLSRHRVVGSVAVIVLAVLTAPFPPVLALAVLTTTGVAFAAVEMLHIGDPRTRQPRPAS
ncbi:low temperature requirement protein A [Solwaraspora sp. WMMB335]|uniref:low temperature requirement protein A n=1 Tax=Solwaraspora sp. WMMB335 TaxID=3404118 RepID=UPI003B92A3FC